MPRCAQVRRSKTWARARGVCACCATLRPTSPSLRSSTRFAERGVEMSPLSDTLQSNSRRACYQCTCKTRGTLQPELVRPSVPFLARVTTRLVPRTLVLLRKPPVRLYTPILQLTCLLHERVSAATSAKQLRSDARRRHYPGAWCCRVACQPRGCGRVRSSRLEAGRQALEVAGGRQVTAQAGQAALHCVDTYAVGRSVVCCTYGARRNRPPAHRTYL